MPPEDHQDELTVPDEATQREVLRLWRQVDRLAHQGQVGTIRAAAAERAVQPQDRDSGLVERVWTRKIRGKGEITERTLEGEQVKAAWMDRDGQLHHAAGTVIRNAAGELVVESWAGDERQETAVPRESMVIRRNGLNLRP